MLMNSRTLLKASILAFFVVVFVADKSILTDLA